MVRKFLLVCGILSSLLYIGMNVLIPMHYDGYNYASQVVSEISAIGAPTRQMWVMWGTVYGVLVMAFGWGVRMSAGSSRALRIVGVLIILHAIFGFFWPPMHQREVLAAGGGTISDTLHIAWTFVTIPLFLLEIGLGATAFGKVFKWYSILSIIVIILFGMITGFDSPAMEADLPTPLIGVWERINIAGYMVWLLVFAVLLLRKDPLNDVTYKPAT
jgi:hypothetical protein